MKPRDCPKCNRRLVLYDTRLRDTDAGLQTTHYYYCSNDFCDYQEQEAFRRQMPEELPKNKL